MAVSYRPFQVPRFDGGLVLTSQPDVLEPNQALDVLNCIFSERGAVRSRDGYAKLTDTALTNQPDSLTPYLTSGGTKRLLVGNGNRLDVLTSFPGATAANTTTPTASPHFFTRFGGPTQEVVYYANGTDQVGRLAGTTFSAPAGLSGQTGKFVAFWENRLVVARESGTTGGNNPSSVNFSAPAAPEDFSTVVWEDIGPGDGEQIMGICTWRELLFVFKETYFAVFYGIGTAADGTADPQWRAVKADCGLAAPKAVVAARDGVYFLDRKGVYKTTGQEPQLVSDAIEPFFTGSPTQYFQSETLNEASIDQAAMGWFKERLYLACPTGVSSTNDRTLVFDPRYGWWSLYDLPVAAMTPFRPSSDEELVFAYAAGDNHLGRHSSAYTADDMSTTATGGSAITSRWRSGWVDMGDPGVKRIRQTRLWGEGEVEFKLTRDFLDVGVNQSVRFGGEDTANWADAVWADAVWSFDHAIAPVLIRQGRRGTTFSVELSHSVLNERWSAHRMDHHLAGSRVPSTIRTEVA